MNKQSTVWSDLYHEKEARTFKKQQHLQSFIKPGYKYFLELFTATGQNQEILKSKNSQAVCFGVDYDLELCKAAKGNGFVSVVSDVGKLTFKDESFDLIYSNSFHHVSKLSEECIDDVMKLLKPGGRLVGVEPYGFFSTLSAGIIYFMPDVLINVMPEKFERYLKAIKYECRNEDVIFWHFKYTYRFKNRLLKYKPMKIYYDFLRVYYCIEKTTNEVIR